MFMEEQCDNDKENQAETEDARIEMEPGMSFGY